MWQLLIPVLLAAGNRPGQYQITWAGYMDTTYAHTVSGLFITDEESVLTMAADTGCRLPLMVYRSGDTIRSFHFRLQSTTYMHLRTPVCDLPAKYPLLRFRPSLYDYSIDTTQAGLNLTRVSYLISTYGYLGIAYNRALTIKHLFAWDTLRHIAAGTENKWTNTDNTLAVQRKPMVPSADTLKNIIRTVYHLDCCYPQMYADTHCIPFKAVTDYCQARANAVVYHLEKQYAYSYVMVVMSPSPGVAAYIYDPVLQQSFTWHEHVAVGVQLMPNGKLYMLDPSVLAYDNPENLENALNTDLELFSIDEWQKYFTKKSACPLPYEVSYDICEYPDFIHGTDTLRLEHNTVVAHLAAAHQYIIDRCDCYRNFSWPEKW